MAERVHHHWASSNVAARNLPLKHGDVVTIDNVDMCVDSSNGITFLMELNVIGTEHKVIPSTITRLIPDPRAFYQDLNMFVTIQLDNDVHRAHILDAAARRQIRIRGGTNTTDSAYELRMENRVYHYYQNPV